MTNFNYNKEVMGASETEPGALFVRLWNPTEFDKTVEAIRKRLKAEYTWDLVNTELWGLIGAFGGPIKKWLTLYIKESNQLGKPYYKSDVVQWENIFAAYGYDKKTTDTYLRVLRQLYAEGAISKTIYDPNTYNATDDPEAGQVVWYETRKMIYGTTGMIIAGGIGYLLIREYIFNAKRKG